VLWVGSQWKADCAPLPEWRPCVGTRRRRLGMPGGRPRGLPEFRLQSVRAREAKGIRTKLLKSLVYGLGEQGRTGRRERIGEDFRHRRALRGRFGGAAQICVPYAFFSTLPPGRLRRIPSSEARRSSRSCGDTERGARVKTRSAWLLDGELTIPRRASDVAFASNPAVRRADAPR
jgi:hypothetical protein